LRGDGSTDAPRADALSDRLGPALKDASLAALVALLLFSLLLGVRLPDGAAQFLVPRPGLLGSAVAIVFIGRLALYLFWWSRPKAARASWLDRVALPRWAKRAPKYLPWLLVGVAALFPLVGYGLQEGFGLRLNLAYWIDLATLILTYVMLAWGLNIVIGLAGLLDLGYVAFYAVGAYTFALLATNYGLGFWICLPLAGVLAAFSGILLGFPILRLRGDYLAIVTLAFGEIIRVVLLNWTSLTNGPNGILGIPQPSFFGLPMTPGGEGTFHQVFGIPFNSLHPLIFLYFIILVLALLTNVVTLRLRRLPVGRAWEALREDEIAARSLGVDMVKTKLAAFAIGATFGGFAGAFFATRQGFVSPESFTFIESAVILAIVVLGGMGSQLGIAIAAIVMIGGVEMLRNTAGLQAIFGRGFDPALFRMLLFGLAMIAIMVWKPRGLVSSRKPTVALGEARTIGEEYVAEGRG
jgi:branched-chain amino acid transport system permease protein